MRGKIMGRIANLRFEISNLRFSFLRFSADLCALCGFIFSDNHQSQSQITKTIMKKLTNHLTHLTYLTFSAAVLLATAGCTVLTYTAPTGERFTRGSLGANTSISSLAIEATTNGVRRVELRGYQNDSSQALSAVTEAAVKAAIESAK
jgi:hypothetical protein